MADDLVMNKYTVFILKSGFPQVDFLSPTDLVKYVKKRGFNTTIEELEYFDKVGLLRPALRIKSPKKNGYYLYSTGNTFAIQEFHLNGLTKLPKEGDYCPWSSYQQESEEIHLLYHPYQILQIENILHSTRVIVSGRSFDTNINPEKFFRDIKEKIEASIKRKKKSNDEILIPRIGLLMILDDAYRPYLGHFRSKIGDDSYYERWLEWRTGEFSPQKVLEQSNFSVEQVKGLYEFLSATAIMNDPLSNWFILLQIMKDSRRKELKGEALLAQDYYDFIYMLGNFILDLTGDKMLDPDDLRDGRHGTWKPRIYGEPFDYTTKKTQKNILDRFLIERPFKLGIVLEGETEEHVINLILDAIYVDNKRSGFFLYNAKGQGNIKKNLQGLFYLSNLDEIALFLILDNDKDSERIEEELKEFVTENMIHKWEKDFEYDNFGILNVVSEVNEVLRVKGYKEISFSDVESKLSGTQNVLMKVIGDIVWIEHKIRLDDIVSKKDLAGVLIRNRLQEISIERNSEQGWQPKLPIETVLKKIFHEIPRSL